jgi:hypothetical protein
MGGIAGQKRLVLSYGEAQANFSRITVRDTPDFDHLKSDPAFKAIIAGA